MIKLRLVAASAILPYLPEYSVWQQGGGSCGASHFSKGELYEFFNVVPVHNVFSLTTNVVRNQLLNG